MSFFQKLASLWRKRKPEPQPQRQRSFGEYREAAPEVLRYLRREKQIARRDLELLVIDNEEEPAWQVRAVIESLLPDLKLLSLVTGRPDAFFELAQDAFEAYGLLIVVSDAKTSAPAGNLVLDLRDWEKQLDILRNAGYNNISSRNNSEQQTTVLNCHFKSTKRIGRGSEWRKRRTC